MTIENLVRGGWLRGNGDASSFDAGEGSRSVAFDGNVAVALTSDCPRWADSLAMASGVAGFIQWATLSL